MSRATLRPVLRAGYGLGVLLTAVPLANVWLATGAWHPGDRLWRVAALGQLGTSLMLPLVGAFVLVGTAILLEDLRVLRLLAVVAGAMAVLLSAALAVFVRDALQVRGVAGPGPRQPRLPQVVLAYSAVIWVSGWLSVGVYRVWRWQEKALRRERDSVLLVREATARPVGHGVGASATPPDPQALPEAQEAASAALTPPRPRGRRARGAH